MDILNCITWASYGADGKLIALLPGEEASKAESEEGITLSPIYPGHVMILPDRSVVPWKTSK